MKLTDEQIEQILEGAPHGAAFFDGDDYSDINGLVWDKRREKYVDCWHFVHGDSLDLYREILTLRQKLHHMAQADRAVYTRATELSKRVEDQKETIFNLRQHVQVLKDALRDQLNDCINFNGGKLTDCILEQSSAVLKGSSDDLSANLSEPSHD